MAHFAQLDENNIVTQVIVVANEELLDENGIESEAKGVAFCEALLGGKWVQTSYNARFRKRYAGIGYIYRADVDAFIPPQPFPSWTLNTETCSWDPPVPMPADGKNYQWDEPSLSWVEVVAD